MPDLAAALPHTRGDDVAMIPSFTDIDICEKLTPTRVGTTAYCTG